MNIESLNLDEIEGSPIGRMTYDAIAKSIVTGQLKPGEPLSDRQIADALGVSRTPVRDALHMLVSSGLVARRGRVGWSVTEFGEQNVKNVYQLRRLLEPAGFEYLDDWDPALFDEFSALAHLYDGPPNKDDLSGYLEADRELHRLFVRASGNELLGHFYGTVELQIDRIRHFVPSRNWLRIGQSFEEHAEILSAIADRDAKRAREALEKHIWAAEQAILDLL